MWQNQNSKKPKPITIGEMKNQLDKSIGIFIGCDETKIGIQDVNTVDGLIKALIEVRNRVWPEQ